MANEAPMEVNRQVTMRNLVMYVARAFYDTRFVVVLDQLARHEVLKDDELAGRVGLNGKDLAKLTTKLLNDGLITVYRQNTSRTGETLSRITSKGYYYIDHGSFCNVVKWRIAEMRRLIDNKLRNELAQQGFVCPNCKKTFQTLDILHLSRPGGLFCDQCDTELVDNHNKEEQAGNEDRMQRFNYQTAQIRDRLKETEEMVMPKVDILDWIKKHPTIVPTAEGEQSKDDDLAIAGEKPDITVKQEYEVVLTNHDLDDSVSQAKKASDQRKQNALPAWYTHSTVTGHVTAFGVKNVSQNEEADGVVEMDSHQAKLLEDHEGRKSVIGDYYKNLEVQERLSQAQTPMDTEDAHPTRPYDEFGSSLSIPGSSRSYSVSSIKRKLDMADFREDGGPSKHSRSTSYQSSPMSTQEDAPAVGKDDPMVSVNGTSIPLSQVTDEHHDLMTPEEYEKYAELVMAAG